MQTQEVEKMEENKMDKNLEHVNEIVKTMEKYASGDYFIYNGDLFPIDRDEFAKEEGCLYREGVYIMHDGKEIADNDLEIATIGDYFNDFYDIDYIVDSNKKYKACRVLVAFGGPNICIDTRMQRVRLSWWGEYAKAYIPDDLCEQIDDFFKAIYEC